MIYATISTKFISVKGRAQSLNRDSRLPQETRDLAGALATVIEELEKTDRELKLVAEKVRNLENRAIQQARMAR